MRIVIFSFLIFCCFSVRAHDPDRAYFEITQSSEIIVEAELPWTIRNAVIKEYPNLEKASSKEEMMESLSEYVKKNFIIFSNDNQPLALRSIKEAAVGGHSHQSTFIFEFEQGEIYSIQNTIMFNLYSNQKNFNTLNINNEAIKFETTLEQPGFTLDRNINYFWYGLFALLTIVLIIVWVSVKPRI